jgi:hypothetical protein
MDIRETQAQLLEEEGQGQARVMADIDEPNTPLGLALLAGASALRAQADAVTELEALRFWAQGQGRLGHVIEQIDARLSALKGAS